MLAIGQVAGLTLLGGRSPGRAGGGLGTGGSRRGLRLASLLLGAVLATALSLVLLLWQAGRDLHHVSRGVTPGALLESWLVVLLPGLSGAYAAGRRWGR